MMIEYLPVVIVFNVLSFSPDRVVSVSPKYLNAKFPLERFWIIAYDEKRIITAKKNNTNGLSLLVLVSRLNDLELR